jgi:glutathione synthase
MRSLFVMDPLARINIAGDSTYVVMRELCDRGHPVLFCEPHHLYANNGRGRARAWPVQVTRAAPHFATADAVDIDLGEVDVVWMRKDPPFDMHYIFSTYILDMVPPTTLVVNDPIGLKVFNEKLWAMQFTDLHPPTLLTQDAAAVIAFVNEHGRSVLKPWDGNGGRGILMTHPGDRNLRSMIEVLTGEGHNHIIVQPYIEKVDLGDKRIILFDGDPVGAMNRIPTGDDFRGNMHVGARVEACDLTPRDQEICDRLGPELKQHGQVFVGIDVIDGWLTEINITSPTGLQEIRTLTGKALEGELVDRVAAKLALLRERA